MPIFLTAVDGFERMMMVEMMLSLWIVAELRILKMTGERRKSWSKNGRLFLRVLVLRMDELKAR
jgi:1,2-phenylacetyl-CoA epoxidase PaaB subunit